MPRSAELDATIDAAVGQRYSAIVVRVERAGSVVYERAAGSMQRAGGPPAAVDTRFDLASITKVFVATVALALVARGDLALDASLADVVPEWCDTPHRTITLRRILAHTGGFRSGADFRTLFDENIEAFALHAPLVAEPGARVVYSDIGFLALGVVLARRARVALRTLVERELFAFGAHRVTYEPRVPREAIPASEYDAWRGLVMGSVHDEKAALAGGVAGHAGLFGDARDVALLAEWFLGPRFGRPAPLPADLTSAATAEQAPDAILRRGLGWALKTSDANSCGALMSAATFGHTGFTGTSVWADPPRDLSIVTLTNAVHFGRADLRDFRAAICDAAVEAYG